MPFSAKLFEPDLPVLEVVRRLRGLRTEKIVDVDGKDVEVGLRVKELEKKDGVLRGS